MEPQSHNFITINEDTSMSMAQAGRSRIGNRRNGKIVEKMTPPYVFLLSVPYAGHASFRFLAHVDPLVSTGEPGFR